MSRLSFERSPSRPPANEAADLPPVNSLPGDGTSERMRRPALPEAEDLQPFGLTVVPVAGESFSGYIRRLAERTMEPSMSGLHTLVGARLGSNRLAPEAISRLSTISGFMPAVLESRLGASARFGHSEGRQSPWPEATASRICPECVAEAPIHRQVWHHVLVEVCPIHEGPIIDACPDCGSPLRWQRPRLEQCCNGHPLVLRHFEKASDVLLRATRHLYDRVGLNGGWRKPSLNEGVASLSNDEFVSFVKKLGFLDGKFDEFRLPGGRGGSPMPRNSLTIGKAACRRGMELVARWPDSLGDLLGPFIQPGQPFIVDQRLLNWLNHTFVPGLQRHDVVSYELIRNELSALASRCGDDLSFPPKDADELISIDEIIRVTGSRKSNILAIAAEAGWRLISRNTGAGKMRYVERTEFERWRIAEDRNISFLEAGELLGLQPSRVRRLASLGLLGGDAQAASRLRKPVLLKRSKISKLLARLERQRLGPSRRTRYPAAECPCIPAEDGRPRHRTLTGVIQAVAAGKLRYWGEANVPESWHLHEGDVQALRLKPWMAYTEARKLTGLHVSLLRLAVGRGLIEVEYGSNGRERLVRQGVHAFMEKYCSSIEIQRARGIRKRRLTLELQAFQIEPISLGTLLVVERSVATRHGLLPSVRSEAA